MSVKLYNQVQFVIAFHQKECYFVESLINIIYTHIIILQLGETEIPLIFFASHRCVIYYIIDSVEGIIRTNNVDDEIIIDLVSS